MTTVPQQAARAGVRAGARYVVGHAAVGASATSWAGPAALLTAVAMVVVALLGLIAVFLVAATVGIDGQADSPTTGAGGFSPQATADIPAEYLPLYQQGAATCPGYPGPLLAAIGAKESNHGRGWPPAGPKTRGIHSGANFAGAAGPMQIGIGGKAGHTWDGSRRSGPVHPAPPPHSDPGQHGYGVDGNGDGLASVYDPADAIHSAAKIECAWWDKTPADLWRAVYRYNAGPNSTPTERDSVYRNYVTPVLDTYHNYLQAAPSDPGAALTGGTPPGYGTPGPCGLSPATDYAKHLVTEVFGVTDIGGCDPTGRGHIEGSDHYPDAKGQAHAIDVMTGTDQALAQRIADWMVANAGPLHAKQVITLARIWTPERGWYAYNHPDCRSTTTCSPTLMHMDHVHLSVEPDF
jgi:hypothetical protein